MVLIYHQKFFLSLKTFYNFSSVWIRTKTVVSKRQCATDYTTEDSARLESNQRPHDPKSRILPSELLAGKMGKVRLETLLSDGLTEKLVKRFAVVHMACAYPHDSFSYNPD